MSEHIITPDLIALARRKGACAEALEWLEAEPRTLDEFVDEYAAWAEWAVCHLCGPEGLRVYEAATEEAWRVYDPLKNDARRAYNAAKDEARRMALLTLWEVDSE